MKNQKILIFIFCIIIILIILIPILLNQYYTYNNPNSLDKAIENKKEYGIVYLSGNIDNVITEEYLIVDSNQKIIQETKILTGHSDAELNTIYKELKQNGGPVIYNVRIKNKSLIYNTVMLNGKNINEYIDIFKKSVYQNKIIKEI
jgi:uncharacterized alpha/beta hydrolase family protein